jgi:benzodiazapine receptor
VIIVLWAAIFQNIKVFLKISKPAGYLLVPYILWVSFAAILNLSIFFLNK